MYIGILCTFTILKIYLDASAERIQSVLLETPLSQSMLL